MEKLPSDFAKALKTNPKAAEQWKTLTPIARRDFVSWIESAKQAETRARRIIVSCDKLTAGKRRPCCYAIVPINMYKALDAAPKAKAHWKTLTPDARRDFVSWIDGAKDGDGRSMRIEKVCVKLAAGKSRP